MKFICVILLFALAGVAHAGGDFVLGRVSAFTGEDGNYRFHFSQTATRPLLLEDCAEFDVTVEHEHVPWFSWLIPSSHPSKKETAAAAVVLRTGQLESREVYFGFMGYGLVPTDAKCRFKSRGMAVKELEGKQLVLSYHELT
jgi:hypothetical protein